MHIKVAPEMREEGRQAERKLGRQKRRKRGRERNIEKEMYRKKW